MPDSKERPMLRQLTRFPRSNPSLLSARFDAGPATRGDPIQSNSHRTAEPLRAKGSSETDSEPIDGTVAAASEEQVANSQGRIRTPVRWGQGIPLQPAMTIQRTGPKQVNQAVQTTSQVSEVQTSILSNILPGHASVTDAVTRPSPSSYR